MKTAHIPIALMFAGSFLIALSAMPSRAQDRPSDAGASTLYGYGLGFVLEDSCARIVYVSRESPLRDLSIKQGDEIDSVNAHRVGLKFAGTNAPAMLEARSLIVCRTSSGKYVDGVVHAEPEQGSGITQERGHPVLSMLDRSTSCIRLADADGLGVAAIERMLDSLSTGDNGYGNDPSTVVARTSEARTALHRENPRMEGAPDDAVGVERAQRAREAFQAAMDGYLADKYGWKMETLLVDARGASALAARRLLRELRLYAEEHQLKLGWKL